METRVFGAREVREAAELIKRGEVVAFPTETVYGLGANALDARAVKKVFAAKGRPSDNPLIVHVCSESQLKEVAVVPISRKELVKELTDFFWPGPLTIVLKKKKVVPREVSGGLETVAVRMPRHRIALDLIKYAGVPIAAPSANLSGKPSGTRFEHVLSDFNGRIAGIIKGRPSEIGLESTVVDLSEGKPVLLRPGAVCLEDLKKFLPEIEVGCSKKSKKVKSPGMKYKHYCPDARVVLFEKSCSRKKIVEYKKKLEKEGRKVKVIQFNELKLNFFSRNLYSIFRKCDEQGIDYILIKGVEEKGIGLALMNRLRKAAFEVVEGC